MGFKHTRVFFLSYLILSTLGLSAAEVEVTDQLASEIADDFMTDYDDYLDKLVAEAPDSPDNDIDNKVQARFFFFALLAKIAIVLVKVAIKVAPIIIKAAVAVKAKAVAVGAAALAKVSTVSALKATAISVGKAVLADIAIDATIDVVTNVISKATSSEPEVPQKPLNIFDFYDNNEECTCRTKKKECECCVKPDKFEKGCMDIKFEDTLWNQTSSVRIGTYYGGKDIIIRTIKVGRPSQKCVLLSEPFQTVKMCVATYGRTKVGRRVLQCFSVYFNKRGLTKCVVQNRKNKLWFQKVE